MSIQLEFETGDADNPVGHALVYFRDAQEPDQIGVTYIVILPVPLDIGKYMPPFLAGQMAEMSADVISSFAFPPAPEPFESFDEAMRLSTRRGDDLLFGGTIDLSDVFEAMEKVNEASTEYGRIYSEAHSVETGGSERELSTSESVEIDDELYDLMYGGMDEADLLTELSQQLGRMRYSVEGGDRSKAIETEAKIRAIGRYLPANREISKIIAAATSTSPRAAELAQLYVERAYCLYREDYLRLKKIDQDIAGIEVS